MIECVHVTTQEEWNFICTFYEERWDTPTDFNYYKNYKDQSCIDLSNGNYATVKLHKENHFKIYSFEEWCKINNIKTNKQSMEKQMLDVLNKTYDNLHLRRTTVPLFMSNPGIGKTSIIQKFAKDKGVKLVKITLSQRMPNEVVGMVI